MIAEQSHGNRSCSRSTGPERSIGDPGLTAHIDRELDEKDDPSSLVFELTETAAVRNSRLPSSSGGGSTSAAAASRSMTSARLRVVPLPEEPAHTGSTAGSFATCHGNRSIGSSSARSSRSRRAWARLPSSSPIASTCDLLAEEADRCQDSTSAAAARADVFAHAGGPAHGNPPVATAPGRADGADARQRWILLAC